MSEKKTCKADADCPSRLGKVGGQAVLEGVMMKAGSRTVTTCRKEDGTLAVTDNSFVSVRDKHKILNFPIIRGVVNFVEMMILSVKTLGASADAMGLDEEENPGKFEKWLAEKLGLRLTDLIMVISVILGLGLSVLLFLFLPIWIAAGINLLLDVLGVPPMGAVVTSFVEGFVKIGIFVSYLYFVSLMNEIKRTFMYHGAEHKSIACFEAGEELTPENAARHKRFHPRCGTSFMFFMILLGIFAGVVLKTALPSLAANTWLYSLVRLLILPLLMGVGYEFIRFAGSHDNIFTKILSAPGLWVQRITTKEPTSDMLEVAIISLKCALRDDYPEFKEFYESRPWESEDTDSDSTAKGDESSAEGSDSTVAAEDTSKADTADSADIFDTASAISDSCAIGVDTAAADESSANDAAIGENSENDATRVDFSGDTGAAAGATQVNKNEA